MESLSHIVKETLDKNGVLSEMTAKLKKHVFDVIHHTEDCKDHAEKVNLVTKDESDQIVLDLVRDYLLFYKLDYTMSVLRSEAGIEDIPTNPNRSLLATKLSLGAQKPKCKEPLLKKLICRSIKNDMFQ